MLGLLILVNTEKINPSILNITSAQIQSERVEKPLAEVIHTYMEIDRLKGFWNKFWQIQINTVAILGFVKLISQPKRQNKNDGHINQ